MKIIKPRVVCLMGPTASGKTDLALKLTDYFPFEIISVDSAMVYRGMDIGTAKPNASLLKNIPHRLIDIRDPKEAYSAAEFCRDALREIKEVIAQGRIPLLVGGTMLYFHALQKGLAKMPSRDPLLREKITEEGNRLGWDFLHKRLAEVDQEASLRIHPHDCQRIQRALEVYMMTGKNVTEWQKETSSLLSEYNVCNIMIAPSDRAILHDRIEKRFLQMLANGLIEEVEVLYARGDLDLRMPSIRSLGYRQVWLYLQGAWTFEEMREKGVIATRQFAKRQLTWCRNGWQDAVWFDGDDSDLLTNVRKYLT